MNVSNLKFSLGGFFGGLLVGSAVTWWLTRRRYSARVADLETDIERLLEKYDSRLDELSELCTDKAVLIKENRELKSSIHAVCDGDTETMIYEHVVAGRTVPLASDMDRDCLHDLLTALGYSGEDTGVVEDSGVRVEEMPVENGEPYIISEMDFVTSDGYDKIAFTYFSADDTLCDTDDDILDQDNLGITELLLEFTRTSEPAIFIRDEVKALEYEIVWDDGSYQATVLGLNPEALVLLPRIFRDGAEHE